MAQRNSASANEPASHPPGAAAPEPAPAAAETGPERRRAAAFLDLWERQLAYTAAQATHSTATARKGPKAGA